ncbi:MAG: cytochrome P450, partial [Chloroflexota bacterium]
MIQSTPPMLSGGWPILGHALEFDKDLEKICLRGFKEHNGPFAIKLLSANIAVINGSDLTKFFYTQTDKKLNIGLVYDNFREALGDAIFLGTREQYINQRVLLQALFSRERMVEYVKAMEAEIQLLLDSLGDEGVTNFTEDFLRLTQYAAGRAFLGEDFRKLFGGDFWAAFNDLSKAVSPTIPKNLPLPVNIRRNRGRRLINKTFEPIIAARRENPEQYDDTIAFLANTPQKDGTLMTDQQIIDFMTAIFWAGHETTAGQSAWLVTLLLQHPDYLECVKEEIAANLKPGEPITGRTLRGLQYTYWAIDETARMRPAAPIQMRLVEEDLELGGYYIPAGWLLMANGPVNHNDPEIWENPEQFDPMRYSPNRNEGKGSFVNVNFGGGTHKCAGMNFAKNEMAMLVAMLFQQFEVELLSKDPHTVFGMGA